LAFSGCPAAIVIKRSGALAGDVEEPPGPLGGGDDRQYHVGEIERADEL
jgi:hypothetical protein